MAHGATAKAEEESSASGDAEGFDAATEAAIQGGLRELGYDIEGILGGGGFGLVYAASRPGDDMKLAIKVGFKDGADAIAEMEREAAMMRAAAGPAVPAVLWQGRVLSKPCLVLERVQYPTLAARMAERAGQPFEFAEAARFAEGLLDALEAVHAAGVLHLDLKPENVLCDDAGSTMLVDFGLSRTLGEERRSAPEAGEGEAAGTAEYMSPEQCKDVPDLDLRADVYSAGILLYELFRGAPPFFGKAADVREAQLSRRVAPLPSRPDLPLELDAVVRGCLSKDREPRCASIGELRAALARAKAGPMPEAPPAAADKLATARAKKAKRAGRADRADRAASRGTKEKRSVGLLFFESRSSLAALQSVVGASGGEIAQSKGTRYVVAFGHAVSSNPVRPALSAAHRLIGSDLASRVVIDVAQVTVQVRPDGSRRFFGVVLSAQDRYPEPTDDAGVCLTEAATQVLPELSFTLVPGRSDRFVMGQQAAGDHELTATAFGMDETPLIGRTEVLHQLVDAAGAATQGPQPTIFAVTAKSGYGRTHLASALAEGAPRTLPDCEVLRLAPRQDVLGAQGRVMPEMLRRLLDLPLRAEADDARAMFCERLGDEIGDEVWAAASFTMGYLDARHPDVDRLSAAPGALRWAVARAGGEALRQRARMKPQLVVLDDAHQVDDAVLDALEFATLADHRAPVFVCVLASENFGELRPHFGSRAGHFEQLELGPLAQEDAMILARLLLHPVEHVPQSVLTTLAERTQCVPRLLTELVRGLKREGIVRQNEAGTMHYIATDELDKLPDLPIVQWNARREIEALPSQLEGHARLASVLGVDFSVGEMDALATALERSGHLDVVQLDPAVGITRLVEARILRRHKNGRYDFRYPLLRDTIYETQPEARLKALHAAAFQVYDAATDMPAERRRPRLALHAARGGHPERAAEEYLSLGKELGEAQSYLPAEAAFGSALELLGEAADLRAVEAARGRGLMRFRLGRNEDAVGDLELARTRAEGLGAPALQADIMLDEATVLDWRFKVEESAALVEAAQKLVTDPDPLLEVRLASNLTRVLHRAGDPEGCVRVGSEAAKKALSLGEAGYESLVITLLMVGPDCCKLGRFEDAERNFETVLAAAKAHADLHHQAAVYVNRAALWFGVDRVDRVVADLEVATRIAREIGEPFVEINALDNLATVLFWAGGQPEVGSEGEGVRIREDLQPASEHAARCAQLAVQLWGASEWVSAGLKLLVARIANYRGHRDEVARIVEDLRELQRTCAPPSALDAGWGAGETAFLDALELCVSDADEGAWAQLEERIAGLELEPEERLELLECQAMAALAAGREDRGRELYEQAAELARQSQDLLSGRVLRNYARLFGEAGAG
ncbi:MAG: protein kinase [Myxococcales bacterium]|nr:protein kinase [Myxococcales bacterium]